MSAKLFFQGVEIQVPISELGEAMKQLAALTASQKAVQTPAQKVLIPVPASDGLSSEAVRAIGLRFLTVIRDHTLSGGATVEQIMEVLGASHPKGVGSKAAAINKLLNESGFETPEVYTNPRDPNGVRWWKAGPKMEDAISELNPLS